MLRVAGFAQVTAVDPSGGRAAPDARAFVFLARKAQ